MASFRTLNSGLLPVVAILLLIHAVYQSVAGDFDARGGSRGLMITSGAGRGNISGTQMEAEGLCASVVAPQGYECQEFEVETRDGYVLTVHRIPRGSGGAGEEGGGAVAAGKRQPVLLQHGVLMDGTSWLLNSPEQSLAFVLADAGFDVWIANIRGTRWSRRHVSLDPSSSSDYWAWSWDELAAYDLPATVELVYGQTGRKLHYVGHSMGTLIALSSFSEGKLVSNLKSAALLSPVAYLSHMTTPLGILAANAFLGELIRRLGLQEFNPTSKIVTDLLRTLCHMPGVDCYDLISSITGTNCCLNASTVELYLEYEPQPTSVRTMIHFAQTFRDGGIAKYDFETSEMNMEHYGQSTPPAYNMSNIPRDFPLFFSYGGRDMLSDAEDVRLLLNDIRGHDNDKLTVQFVEKYAHADFVMAVNAKSLVYQGMMEFFHRHN